MSLLSEYENWTDASALTELRVKPPEAVWLVGDTHIGAKTCRLGKLKEHLSIAQDAGAEAIFIGDALECVTLSSTVAQAGALYDQWQPPDDHPINAQLDIFCEVFSAIPVIGIHNGNHERRAWRQGFDLVSEMLKRLGNGKDLGVLASIQIGKTKFLTSHGEGAGQKHLEYRLRDFGHHHVCAGGHTHSLSVTTVASYDHPPTHLIRTGSYLQDPRYALERQYSGARSPVGSVLVHLDAGELASVEVLT